MTIEVGNINTYHLKSSCLPPVVHALEDWVITQDPLGFGTLILSPAGLYNISKGVISTSEKERCFEKLKNSTDSSREFENFLSPDYKGSCFHHCSSSKAQKWGVFLSQPEVKIFLQIIELLVK